MLNQESKRKNLNLKLYILFFGVQLLTIFGLCGCYVVDFVTPTPKPYNRQIIANYDMIMLRESSSADVLSKIYTPDSELLSQSKSIIASHGQDKKGYRNWVTMVAFDERNLLCNRKYLLIADEKPKILFTTPWESLSFDCQMVLDNKLLDEPYASENAKRVAILRRILENTRDDIRQVGPDNKMIDVCGGLMKQTLEAVLVTLENSPASAARLSEPDGLAFSHASFDRGKAGMIIVDNTVAIRIRGGASTRLFENITPSVLP